jgi:hypothetical protein
MPFQILVSYARNDDLPPLDGDGKGFITTLLKHLEFHFTCFGEPTPLIWRDKRAIARSEQFDPIIETGIRESALLLVVLSNNWVHREFCRRELDLFQERWKSDGENAVKRRIIVVGENHIEPAARPPLLQGQEGYLFYDGTGVIERNEVVFVEAFKGRGFSSGRRTERSRMNPRKV